MKDLLWVRKSDTISTPDLPFNVILPQLPVSLTLLVCKRTPGWSGPPHLGGAECFENDKSLAGGKGGAAKGRARREALKKRKESR